MAEVRPGLGDVAVWGWLITLLLVGLAVAFGPLTKIGAVAVIFVIAAVKAGLVVRYYMHLRSEALLIYAIAGVPVLLFIGLTLTLVPDIVFRH